MHSVGAGPYRDTFCPIPCIVKAVLFALLAVFVLYLPLGNLYIVECNASCKAQNQKEAMCYLCDFYIKTIRVLNKSKEVAEVLLCKMMEILHQAKIKFYRILDSVDKNDLCRSVCSGEDMDKGQDKQTPQARRCKCSRKCCKKKSDTTYP